MKNGEEKKKLYIKTFASFFSLRIIYKISFFSLSWSSWSSLFASYFKIKPFSNTFCSSWKFNNHPSVNPKLLSDFLFLFLFNSFTLLHFINIFSSFFNSILLIYFHHSFSNGDKLEQFNRWTLQQSIIFVFAFQFLGQNFYCHLKFTQCLVKILWTLFISQVLSFLSSIYGFHIL